MTNKDVKKSVLLKIKKEHIEPKSKWRFALKEWGLWVAMFVTVVVGAFAASVAIFRISTNDWDIHEKLGENFGFFVMRNLPYFWLVVLALFIGIAYLDFRNTRKGYKYGFPMVVGSTVVVSIVLGFALFGVGAARHLDEQAEAMLPFHGDPRLENWNHPQQGLLSGEILEIFEGGDVFTLESHMGDEWEVRIGKLPRKFVVGTHVGLLGKTVDEWVFEAEEVRPWRGNMPPGMGHEMMGSKNLLKENLHPMRIR